MLNQSCLYIVYIELILLITYVTDSISIFNGDRVIFGSNDFKYINDMNKLWNIKNEKELNACKKNQNSGDYYLFHWIYKENGTHIEISKSENMTKSEFDNMHSKAFKKYQIISQTLFDWFHLISSQFKHYYPNSIKIQPNLDDKASFVTPHNNRFYEELSSYAHLNIKDSYLNCIYDKVIINNVFYKKCIIYNQNEVIKVIRILKHPRNSILNNQIGIMANIFIPKNTIIGRFCGNYMTNEEYNTIFSNNNCDKTLHDHYRMSINCPSHYGINIRTNQTHIISKCNRNWGKVVVDEFNLFGNPMVLMNDVRLNISKKEMSYLDMKFNNAAPNDYKINGIPYIFFRTTRDIYPNEEIVYYYGDSYVL